MDAITAQSGSEEEIVLMGRLRFDAQGHLTGNLRWASEPPLTYKYAFTRDTPTP